MIALSLGQRQTLARLSGELPYELWSYGVRINQDFFPVSWLAVVRDERLLGFLRGLRFYQPHMTKSIGAPGGSPSRCWFRVLPLAEASVRTNRRFSYGVWVLGERVR